MCGIVAIYRYDGSGAVDREELLRIRDRMVSRGPDGAGEWHAPEGNVGLGHRRLAVIDLSETGAQPMVSEGMKFELACNWDPALIAGLDGLINSLQVERALFD